MKTYPRCSFFITLMLITVSISCASTKTLNVWKDEGSSQRLQKVLVISVAELDFMQKHFENVLTERLASRGIEAVPANKVFPRSGAKLDREAIAAKVRELGIGSVLVSQAVSKEETERLLPRGAYAVPASYYDGWYGFYSRSFGAAPGSGSSYDAEYFTVVTNIYKADSEKLVWSSLSRVRVENSRQGAINPLIDLLVKQLEGSKLI